MIPEKPKYVVIVRGPTPCDIARRVSEAHAAAFNSAQRRGNRIVEHKPTN